MSAKAKNSKKVPVKSVEIPPVKIAAKEKRPTIQAKTPPYVEDRDTGEDPETSEEVKTPKQPVRSGPYNLRERPPQKIPLTLEQINERIRNEICRDTISKLSDVAMLPEYKASKATKENVNELEAILIKYRVEEEKRQNIIADYISSLIKPATKGTLRGRKFNLIVQETIQAIVKKLQMNEAEFEVKFEKKCKAYETSEIPDWYILEKKTNKAIIGMNQLDLWGGGQQSNRGSKYVTAYQENTQKNKLLCVVCNEVTITSKRNKTYNLFNVGFTEDTLCYIKNIEPIIKKFFGLSN